MKVKMKIMFGAVLLFMTSVLVFGQGTTTSGMNGKITDTDGGPLPGATVIAVHTPTGSQFGGISDDEGYFRLPNMNVGGPYTITISFIGFESYQQEGIYLTLGQTFRLNVSLNESTVQLAEVAVVSTSSRAYDPFDGNKTGAETVVGNEEINAMPSVARDITDFTRLTPQASILGDGIISIAGINNRYNAISIDGAVNNDVFGLAATGTNGGQTGGTPISMDAIEQFQVTLAPYDVRQSGFAGASINAVTRSGSNRVNGSAYYLFRHQGIAGRQPTDEDIPKEDRSRLANFSSFTTGARVGAPIIKNKLFFFASWEMQRDITPQPFNGPYEGDSGTQGIEDVATHLQGFGYEPGPWENKTRELNSDKFLVRLDWNISEHHKLMARHSYTNLEALRVNASSGRSVSFENNSEYFPSKTNSTAVELKSNYDGFSNDLIVGYTAVRDDRDPLGQNFPALQIRDGSATIYAGSEPYSTANALDQDILTLTNNFSIYKGKHTITIGGNIEYSKTYNLFMRKNYGEYRYNSIADFLSTTGAGDGSGGEVPAYQYERGYSLVDDLTGDGSKAAAEFSMIQWGVYAQDEIQITEDMKLTAGLRIDMPIFLKQPEEDVNFNENTKPALEAAGWDMFGAQAGQMPKGQLLFSPRIGFNWDITGDSRNQLRGGIGIFTSRLPLVWPGGSYTNNGITIGGVYHRSSWGTDIFFRPEWDNQYKNADFGYTDAPWGGQMDLFAKNFKFPQMFRVNAAFDRKLPLGTILTVEGMFTKTINNVLYYNMNVSPNSEYRLTGADNRPYYDASAIDADYTRVIVGTNTNKGYTYNFTVQLQKPFMNGFTASVAYTFGKAMVLNDGTSSQNSSQWRYMESVNGLNNLDLSVSDFDMGHRVVGFISYRKEYFNHAATTISLYYNGQSGQPYSYVYWDSYGQLNGTGEDNNNLIYVPANQSEIVFADPTTANEQWLALDEFIENDAYLSKRRGQYAERNAARSPFSNVLDLRIVQDLFVDFGPRKHTLQLTFDVFNFTNLLNSKWGRVYYVSYNAYQLIDFEGFAADGTTPTFSFDPPVGNVWRIDDSGINSSRWQAQFGLRYIF